MLGDYYPLTADSLALDQWIAWQFDRPEESDGVIQAFRRPENREEARTFKLRGLEPKAGYEVEKLDGGKETCTGRELREKGFTITLNEKPATAVIVYRRVK